MPRSSPSPWPRGVVPAKLHHDPVCSQMSRGTFARTWFVNGVLSGGTTMCQEVRHHPSADVDLTQKKRTMMPAVPSLQPSVVSTGSWCCVVQAFIEFSRRCLSGSEGRRQVSQVH